jgi:hypothetical protein
MRARSRPRLNGTSRQRVRRANVAKAQHQKWLGSMALSTGDRPGAVRHFQHAEDELRAEGLRVSSNSLEANDSRSDLTTNETSQDPNAVNLRADAHAEPRPDHVVSEVPRGLLFTRIFVLHGRVWNR